MATAALDTSVDPPLTIPVDLQPVGFLAHSIIEGADPESEDGCVAVLETWGQGVVYDFVNPQPASTPLLEVFTPSNIDDDPSTADVEFFGAFSWTGACRFIDAVSDCVDDAHAAAKDEDPSDPIPEIVRECQGTIDAACDLYEATRSSCQGADLVTLG